MDVPETVLPQQRRQVKNPKVTTTLVLTYIPQNLSCTYIDLLNHRAKFHGCNSNG